jgi:hypothetical protein
MLDAIGDSLSDFARSDDQEDVEDNADTELGNLGEDDEPGWVMGTISNTVQQRTESVRPQRMKLDQLTQPGWGDAADYFSERDKSKAQPK